MVGSVDDMLWNDIENLGMLVKSVRKMKALKV